LDEVIVNKETPVHFPPSKMPAGDGPLYLELHIYPDVAAAVESLSPETVAQLKATGTPPGDKVAG